MEFFYTLFILLSKTFLISEKIVNMYCVLIIIIIVYGPFTIEV